MSCLVNLLPQGLALFRAQPRRATLPALLLPAVTRIVALRALVLGRRPLRWRTAGGPGLRVGKCRARTCQQRAQTNKWEAVFHQ